MDRNYLSTLTLKIAAVGISLVFSNMCIGKTIYGDGKAYELSNLRKYHSQKCDLNFSIAPTWTKSRKRMSTERDNACVYNFDTATKSNLVVQACSIISLEIEYPNRGPQSTNFNDAASVSRNWLENKEVNQTFVQDTRERFKANDAELVKHELITLENFFSKYGVHSTTRAKLNKSGTKLSIMELTTAIQDRQITIECILGGAFLPPIIEEEEQSLEIMTEVIKSFSRGENYANNSKKSNNFESDQIKTDAQNGTAPPTITSNETDAASQVTNSTPSPPEKESFLEYLGRPRIIATAIGGLIPFFAIALIALFIIFRVDKAHESMSFGGYARPRVIKATAIIVSSVLFLSWVVGNGNPKFLILLLLLLGLMQATAIGVKATYSNTRAGNELQDKKKALKQEYKSNVEARTEINEHRELLLRKIATEISDGKFSEELWKSAQLQSGGENNKQVAIYTRLRLSEIENEAKPTVAVKVAKPRSAMDIAKDRVDQELRAGMKNERCWIMALAKADGDENLAKMWYQKYRLEEILKGP